MLFIATISLIVITYSIYLYVNKIELYNLKKIEIKGNKFVKNDVIESILDIYINKVGVKYFKETQQHNIDIHFRYPLVNDGIEYSKSKDSKMKIYIM